MTERSELAHEVRDVGDEPRVLVVALHGRGGVPEMPSLACVRRSVRVLVPRGPHVVGEGNAWSPLSVTSGQDDALAIDLLESAARIEDLIDAQRMSRVVLAGYSQGAMVALAIAALRRRPDRLVLGAGWCPPRIERALHAGIHVHAVHGDADDIVRLVPTRSLLDRLRARGIDATLDVFPGVGHVASAGMEEALARALGEAVDRVYSAPEVALVVDILLAPDVFVNASVAPGSPPEHIARRVLGKPGAKPKTTRWVMTWTRALLAKAPGFKPEAVDAQMKTIEGLLEVVELQDKTPEGDWVKGLVASAKAAGLKRVVTDHPDLADKTEVDGIAFLSSEAWLVEQTTPPPPPPPKKK